jgi:hypothetical protein
LNQQKEQNKDRDLISKKRTISLFLILFEWVQFKATLLILRSNLLEIAQVHKGGIHYLYTPEITGLIFFTHLNLLRNGNK